MNSLNHTSLNAGFQKYCYGCAFLRWLIDTRPNLACYANRASETGERVSSGAKIQELIQDTRWAQGRELLGLRLRPLDIHSVHIRMCSDAAFANKDYLTSHLGYIVPLADKNKICDILSFANEKESCQVNYARRDLCFHGIV